MASLTRSASYGGQAVVEGVMIRGAKAMAIACRRPDGTVALQSTALSGIYSGPLRRIPLIRGAIVLWETIALGTRGLLFSVNVAAGEEEEEIKASSVWMMMGFTILIASVIFFAGPTFLTSWIEDQISNDILLIVLEGLIRLGVVLGYLLLIGLLGDVRRVFAYHGAEHKAIHAYEAGAPLDVASVQRQSTAHPRCGTSFLLTVVVVSIVVFAVLGNPSLWERVLWRIALIPVIAAISYEIIRFAGQFQDNRLVSLIFKPNLWLQSLTTRQPDDHMVTVAIEALEAAVAIDNAADATDKQPSGA